MTGIVNSTGAKSGIIGTTVGTPSGAAGSVLKTTHVAGDVGAISTTSGVNIIRTTSFTPQSGTNYLYIKFKTSWQAYGQGALVSNAKFNFYHNATRLNTDVDITRYSSHATGEEYHYYIAELNESFYIDETHGDTETGAARTIYFTFEPTSGIHDVNNANGEQTITIWEFS